MARDVIKAAASEGRVQNRNALRHLAMVSLLAARLPTCWLPLRTAFAALQPGGEAGWRSTLCCTNVWARLTAAHRASTAQGEDALEQYVEACSYVPNYDSLVFLP